MNKLPSSRSASDYHKRLTTVYYPDDQIASNRFAVTSTTPMTLKRNGSHSHEASQAKLTVFSVPFDANKNKTFDDKSELMWHPPNHRKQFRHVSGGPSHHIQQSEIFHKPITSQFTAKDVLPLPEKRTFAASDEYDSLQSSFSEENDIKDFILPLSHSMSIEGIYRRSKTYANQYDEFNPLTAHSKKAEVRYPANDLYSKFKFFPPSPDDVNLLASMNQVKIAPYAEHRPRAITSSAYTPSPLPPKYFLDLGARPANYHQQAVTPNTNVANFDASSHRVPYGNSGKVLSFALNPMYTDESIIRENRYNHRPFFPGMNHNWQSINAAPLPIMRFPHDDVYRQRPIKGAPLFPYHPSMKQLNDKLLSQIIVHLNLYPNMKKFSPHDMEIIKAESNNALPLWNRLKSNNENVSRDKLTNDLVSPVSINALNELFDLNEPTQEIPFDLDMNPSNIEVGEVYVGPTNSDEDDDTIFTSSISTVTTAAPLSTAMSSSAYVSPMTNRRPSTIKIPFLPTPLSGATSDGNATNDSNKSNFSKRNSQRTIFGN